LASPAQREQTNMAWQLWDVDVLILQTSPFHAEDSLAGLQEKGSRFERAFHHAARIIGAKIRSPGPAA